MSDERKQEPGCECRARKALAQIQWGNAVFDPGSGENGTEYNLCPMCDQSEARGHAPDCFVGAALSDPCPCEQLRGSLALSMKMELEAESECEQLRGQNEGLRSAVGNQAMTICELQAECEQLRKEWHE